MAFKNVGFSLMYFSAYVNCLKTKIIIFLAYYSHM